MIERRLILSLLAILLSIHYLSGQEAWSLEDCIRHANENNIELKKEELKLTVQSNHLLESKLKLLPSVGIRSGHTNRFGRSVDPLTYQFTTENTRGGSLSAFSEVDLFKGFQGINQVRKNKIDLQKNLAEFEKARQDLAMNITREFLQILFYQELRKIAEKEVDISNQQLKRTQRLVEVGSLTKGDLLDIEALVAMEEVHLITSQNELDLALLNLALMLEIENPDDFEIQMDISLDFPSTFNHPDVESIISEAENYFPGIKAAELDIISAQKDLQIAKGSLGPNLSAISGWGTGYSNQILDVSTGNMMPISEQLGFASTTYLGFSLNIPVFNGLSSLTKVRDAQVNLLDRQFDLDIARKQLRQDIRLAYADASAAWSKYLATEKSVSSLQLAYNSVEQKYNLGILNSFDYKEARKTLSNAQSELLQSKYNFIFNSKILNFYRDINR